MFSKSECIKASAFLLCFFSPVAISNSEHLICLPRESSDPLFATALAEAEASQVAFSRVNGAVLIKENGNSRIGLTSHSVVSSGVFSSVILKEYVDGDDVCFMVRTYKKTPS